MYNNNYRQTVVFGTYKFGSGDDLLGLLKMEATGSVLRKAESQTHLISSVKIDDDKIRIIKGNKDATISKI